MLSIKKRMIATLVLTLALAAAAFAQDSQPAPNAPEHVQPEYVQEKGFKTKVFEVKNRDPFELQSVLRPLQSGFRGATMSASRELNTISVRDFPENIAVIEEAIKRLDVPPSVRPSPDIEFHIHILIASNAAATGDEVPAELNDVIKQLQGTLKYKSYGVMASAVHRARGDGGEVSSNGVAESKLFNIATPGGVPIFYNYNFGRIGMSARTAEGATIGIAAFRFAMRIPLSLGNATQQIQYENVGFNTPVSVREGERVVVGTTTMGDKGLIVVLSARVLNK